MAKRITIEVEDESQQPFRLTVQFPGRRRQGTSKKLKAAPPAPVPPTPKLAEAKAGTPALLAALREAGWGSDSWQSANFVVNDMILEKARARPAPPPGTHDRETYTHGYDPDDE